MSLKSDRRRGRKPGVDSGRSGRSPDVPARFRVTSETLDTWELQRRDFRALLRGASMRKRKAYAKVLKRIEFLQGLPKQDMVQLSDCLQVCRPAVPCGPVQCGAGAVMRLSWASNVWRWPLAT